MKQRAITLLSGGLDSTVATYLAAKYFEIKLALTFDYGQRAVLQEIKTAKKICNTLGIKHKVIEIPWLKSITNTALVNNNIAIPNTQESRIDTNALRRAKTVWVPNRNGIFISIAAAFAESMKCDTIITGFNKEEAETFPDNSSDFVFAINKTLKFSTANKVQVTSPTIKLTKTEIAQYFIKLKIDSGSIWCCYHGGKKLCGKCESCARTIRAFKKNGEFERIEKNFL